MGVAVRQAPADPAEIVARVAAARRDLLLRAHRQRLRFEDLEDCYSQATLELVVRSRRAPFANSDHVKNALEQKFVSRINDRRRALAGRSGIEAALATAVSVNGAGPAAPEIEDRAAAVERRVEAHGDIRRLREVIAELSLDQRLVLHSQVNLQMEVQDFCERYGWSAEKFRKVAQRARAKLRALVAEYQSGERCRRLEPDLLALAAGAGVEEQLGRARAHVENCPACARYVAALNRAARDAAAVLPLPVASAAAPAKVAWLVGVFRRVVTTARHPATELGTSGAAGFTGASTAGVMFGKASVVAICVAGAAGGFAVCEHIGITSAHSPRPRYAHSRGPYVEAGSRGGSKPAIPETVAAPEAHPALSASSQIRREFGLYRARSATDEPRSVQTPAPTAQSRATVLQEAREFGFER
jgi:DNA-directed RNA polymerase specialized sigma24 family protein